MGCPFARQAQEAQLQAALGACPFLRRVAAEQSEAFAAQVATQPFTPARREGPVLPEGPWDISHTFRLFHGAAGIVPLARAADKVPEAGRESGERLAAAGDRAGSEDRPRAGPRGGALAPSAPFATISIPFLNFLVR